MRAMSMCVCVCVYAREWYMRSYVWMVYILHRDTCSCKIYSDVKKNKFDLFVIVIKKKENKTL